MPAAELAALLPGRSAKAVRNARQRFGRWRDAAIPGLCVACDERPVWRESARARQLMLCKGCFIDEMNRRRSEDARANAMRQAQYKDRVRAARLTDGGQSGHEQEPETAENHGRS